MKKEIIQLRSESKSLCILIDETHTVAQSLITLLAGQKCVYLQYTRNVFIRIFFFYIYMLLVFCLTGSFGDVDLVTARRFSYLARFKQPYHIRSAT